MLLSVSASSNPHILRDPAYEHRAELGYQLYEREIGPSHVPIRVGEVADLEVFSRSLGRTVLDSLKFSPSITHRIPFSKHADPSGESLFSYSIPKRFEQFSEFINIAATHEHSSYPDTRYKNDFAWLRVDQTTTEAGYSHGRSRAQHIHREGINELWFHDYMASQAPTPLYFKTDRLVTDNELEDVFQDAEGYSFEVGEVVMANPTAAHSADIARESGNRTQVHLSYSHSIGHLLSSRASKLLLTD
jgi:hypothetical protein